MIITILAMLAILAGVATLSATGFSIVSSVIAQTTSDNATMAGNMTAAGNVTGGNMTDASGSISATPP